MKVIDVQQGSDEWVRARLGLPTASCADRIITPKTRKPSAAQDRYLAQLVAEWFVGAPVEEFDSKWTARGRELEAEAARCYEFVRGMETQTVGLCLTDDGTFGASPDRLVGQDGLLEIKCPSATMQVWCYLHDSAAAAEHWPQMQAQLWVTGRRWADLLIWNPVLPEVLVRVERDEEFIAALAECVAQFAGRLREAKERLAPLRERHLAAATADTGF